MDWHQVVVHRKHIGCDYGEMNDTEWAVEMREKIRSWWPQHDILRLGKSIQVSDLTPSYEFNDSREQDFMALLNPVQVWVFRRSRVNVGWLYRRHEYSSFNDEKRVSVNGISCKTCFVSCTMPFPKRRISQSAVDGWRWFPDTFINKHANDLHTSNTLPFHLHQFSPISQIRVT